jgi:hypothetical protein
MQVLKITRYILYCEMLFIKIQVSWDIMPCQLVQSLSRFGEACSLQHLLTQCHIPEVSDLHQHQCENTKFHNCCLVCTKKKKSCNTIQKSITQQSACRQYHSLILALMYIAHIFAVKSYTARQIQSVKKRSDTKSLYCFISTASTSSFSLSRAPTQYSPYQK